MEMRPSLLLAFLVIHICAKAPSNTISATTTSLFLSCLTSANILNFAGISSSDSSTYYNLLNSSVRNLRFTGPTISKPVAIILPSTKRQLQISILCCKNYSTAIKLRSGGHSYEGLSYTGDKNSPFAIIDLANLNRVQVNSTSSTAWVESGATLGEIYYSVATESRGLLGFPAGSCTTVGSGGHIAGGGFGFLSRKFGLAADNVLDAILIDPNGLVLDRDSMDQDVFWAIRGGGGGSWGAIYAWKIRLVPVPARVAVFTLHRSGPTPSMARLVHKWQYVAPTLPEEFYLSTLIFGKRNGRTSASFSGQFLGASREATSILAKRFPELRLDESECKEMSWIQSVVHYAGLNSMKDLRVRQSQQKFYFKAKSDYVRTPISSTNLVRIFNFLAHELKAYIILDPYGGAMDRIKSEELPFPHRRGNLYGIQYLADWVEDEDRRRESYIAYLREFYEFMAPFVSSNPRAAYVNYMDLDLGINNQTNEVGGVRGAVIVARLWGEKYFLDNFDRLVRAKTRIDPNDVFNNAQSIPPLAKC